MPFIKRNNLFTSQGRSLLAILTKIRLKAIHYNSFFGILWSLVNPVVMLTVMFLIFGRHYGVKVTAYPLYLLVGISCVNFFITSTSYLSGVCYQNRQILLNTLIPHEIVFVSALLAHTNKFMIELLICLLLSWFYQTMTWTILWLIPMLACFFIFINSISVLIALSTNFAQDVLHLWNMMTRVLLFVTPIFYNLSDLSEPIKKIIYYLNPLTPFVIAIRSTFFGESPLLTYGYVFLITGISTMFCYFVFTKMESFAMERL